MTQKRYKTKTDLKNEKIIRHSTSDRVSICAVCKKPFEQVWRPEYEAYTSFKTCPSCRMANARGGINITAEYAPHWGQELVHNSEARFKVMAAGIRWGKDRCSIMEGIRYFIQCLNEERDSSIIPHTLWWVVAPTDKIANQNWRELLANIPREIVVDISKTTRTIETLNGGIIEVQSAYDPESLVGVGLDIVTITEAARIPNLEDVWSNLEGRLNSPGRGLKGKGGVALINSSPLGKNYFYKMWQWGRKESATYDPQWESWTFTTWDNPYMAKRGNEIQKNGRTYKENLKRRMPDKRYRQDYLAEFISDVNSVFPNIDEVFVKLDDLPEEEKQAWEEPEPFEIYTIGYDPAHAVDDPVIWIRNSKGRVVKTDTMVGLGWDSQWDRIAFYSKRYNGAVVNFGKTGLGETIESQLINRGVPCNAIDEQGRNKEKLVENLALIVEQKWCEIPYSEEIEFQFKDYVSIRRKTGTTQYSNATNDGHDDHISAAYFCFADFVVAEMALPYMGIVGGVNTN